MHESFLLGSPSTVNLEENVYFIACSGKPMLSAHKHSIILEIFTSNFCAKIFFLLKVIFTIYMYMPC